MYLSVMCPSVSVIGLSIVRLSVCHFSVPSVCDVLPISVIGLSISVLLSNRPSVCPSLCFCQTVLQSVHLCASVQLSSSLSISVLLSNCPPVCPTDCESDLSSDCSLESSYVPEIPQVTAVAVGL